MIAKNRKTNTQSIELLRQTRRQLRLAQHWVAITESKTERRGAEWRSA